MNPNTRTLGQACCSALMQVAKFRVKQLLKVTPDLQGRLKKLKGDFLLDQHAETNGGSLKGPI